MRNTGMLGGVLPTKHNACKICTQNKRNLFGTVFVGQGLCSCRLTNIGNIIENEIANLSKRFPEINVNKYVIMPNHIHMIILIDREDEPNEWRKRQEQSPCPTKIAFPAMGDIICAFKSVSTKQINKHDGVKGRKIWQFRYYDHIIRNEEDYLRVWQYIDENPAKWAQDKYYCDD